jgi:hypothetical protein
MGHEGATVAREWGVGSKYPATTAITKRVPIFTRIEPIHPFPTPYPPAQTTKRPS